MTLNRTLPVNSKYRVVVALVALGTAGLLSLGTSTPPPRLRVPTGVFIDSVSANLHTSEVVVTNFTARPVKARFMGEVGRSLSVLPGSSTRVCLLPGRYAFELRNHRRVVRRKWLKLAAGRRYLYFHR